MKTKVKVRERKEDWVVCYTEKWRFKLHRVVIYFISDSPGESDKYYTVYRQCLRKKISSPYPVLDIYAEHIAYDNSGEQ